MTPIQWVVVELPYLSQDFVIVLVLIYMIVGMLTVFIVPAMNTIAGYSTDDLMTDNWWLYPLAAIFMVALWPYLLWLWVFDD